MSDHLDKYIKESKVITPDSGEYRRLNRALLKERINNVKPDRRGHHKVLIITLAVAGLIGFSGQISQLGSGDFEIIREDLVTPGGKTIPSMKNQFDNTAFSIPGNFSDQEVDELNRSIAADDGEILEVWGTSYGGKTKWTKYVRRLVNGKMDERGGNLRDRPTVEPDNWMDFLVAHNREMKQMARSTPCQREAVMTFDGVQCRVRIWDFHFPDFGQVTYYLGTPVQDKPER